MVELNKKVEDFKVKALVGGEETSIKLSELKGSKVAIYFYPKDMTPGCTTQACDLRDNFELLKGKNIVVVGVSKDSIKSHRNFAEKKGLPFILASDEDLEVHKVFGVWRMKKFMGREYMGTVRETFLIDEKGILVEHIEKPKVKEHAKEILEGFNIN